MTPLGGSRDLGSHKGYGLAAMVEILSAALPGASLVMSENHGKRTPGTMEMVPLPLGIVWASNLRAGANFSLDAPGSNRVTYTNRLFFMEQG